MRFAEQGIAMLEDSVDTLITIPNDRLLTVSSTNTSLMEAFAVADEVLHHATQGVSDLITVPGIINVDFADVRTIMSSQGRALMGMGMATDEGRAIAAAQQAINSPLLEDVTIQGAKGILINITAGPNLRLHEVEEAASMIMEAAHEDCNIIFGAVIDGNMGDALRITVIATGFDQHVPAEDELGSAVRAHATRRRSQTAPTPVAAAPARRANPLLTAAAARHATASQPDLPLTSMTHGAGLPPPPAYASGSGLHPQQSGIYGAAESSYARGYAVEPEEVPAYLRRRQDPGPR
jgi:cell division protein FtsZ